MPRTKKGCSSPRQMAYARKLFGGQGTTKTQIALNSGYPPSTANKAKEKIESTVGFNAAMVKLANESNNVALAAIHEFHVRGFSGFSNKDLVGALTAIGGAWEKFNDFNLQKVKEESKGNNLRTIFLEHLEKQSISPVRVFEGNLSQPEATPPPLPPVQEEIKSSPIDEAKVIDVENDELDF